jgi:hypothetical protein
MKTAFAMLLAVAFSPVAVSAQTARPAQVGDCPVALHAGHLSDGNLVQTRSAHPKGVGQWLHLTFTSTDSRQIATATFTVRGHSAKPRATLASSDPANSSDAVQDFSIPFTAGANRTAAADLWVPGMTSVQTIDIDSVAYSDGTTSVFRNPLACRVTPDPLMLISSR